MAPLAGLTRQASRRRIISRFKTSARARPAPEIERAVQGEIERAVQGLGSFAGLEAMMSRQKSNPTDVDMRLRSAVPGRERNADLFTFWHNTDQPPPVIGSSVHSRSACMVLERHWEEKPEVLFPIIAVGASPLKLELESTFGTGQSVIDALIRVTGLQLSGKRIAVIGYGNVGSGIARFAKGLNARVSIVQNSAYRALKAVIDGYNVISLDSALERSDIVLSATGATGVVRGEHLKLATPP